MAPQQVGCLIHTPKLPNVPTYGQLNLGLNVLHSPIRDRVGEKVWRGAPDSVIIGIRGRQHTAQLTDSLPGLNFLFLFWVCCVQYHGNPLCIYQF